jgi:neutral ceramidase
MRVGFAEVEITPPVGVDLTGYVARLGPSVGVHDPLYARALLMEDGEMRAALVVCDLLGMDMTTVARLRQVIAPAIGAAPEAVMIACTHTHSGPATFFLHQCGEVDPDYVATLPGKLREAARAAAASLRPVRVAVGEGELPEGAYNRRGAEAAPDTAVGVALLTDEEGAPLVTAMSYGCHPVTMRHDNLLISADYPGAAVRAVTEALGGAGLFLTGASGDVNPVQRNSFEAVDELGRAVADEAVRVARGLVPEVPVRLPVRREVLSLPLLPPLGGAALDALLTAYHDELRQARAADDPVRVRIAEAMVGWARHQAARLAAGAVLTTAEVEVQTLALGPWVLVGVAGELFSGLGARIKAAGEGHPIFVVGYANGDVGYIPDRAAYDAGGYEVSDAYKYYDAPAALAPEAGERVVAAGRLSVVASWRLGAVVSWRRTGLAA